MPLSGTEREVELQRSRGQEPPAHETHGPAWPELVNSLWFARRRIAMWTLLGIALSIGYYFRFAKYEATVQLMPPDSQGTGLASLLPALSGSSGGSSLLNLAGAMAGVKSTTSLFVRVLESRSVQDKVIQENHLLNVYGKKYMVDGRRILTSATAIDEDKKSGVVSLTFKAKDPVLAQNVASSYIQELNNVLIRASTSSARREEDFIGERLEDEKKILADAQQKLSEFSSANMTLNPSDQVRVTVESAAHLNGELIAARAELQGLQQTYTQENVRVKTLRARIAELESELKKMNSGRGPSTDPASPYPSVKALPGLTTQWADLYREVKVHETVFEMLTTQKEVAGIQAVKDTPTAKVLDEPVLPEKKFPRPIWVLLTGTLTSVILSCTGVLLKEKWQSWDEADSRRILLSNMYFGTRNSLNSIWNKIRGRSAAGRNAE